MRVGMVMVSGGSGTMLMAVVVAMAGAVVMRVVMVVMMTVIVVVTMMMVVPMIVMCGAGADALHVVMMAFLLKADFGFEAEHLFAVLAHLAVHVARAFQDLGDPVGEGL